ncbi:type I DNA topoisomerase [Texas Phoenix palm phytoplasma]|uniref:DNA topoisomerase 1 n=1 Tax=Texas Phoenix palm phytoplasma TaxID=176709 RepID=A0ABS5BJH9_9MOLU|nr:type I DNA topoisomerase [Texas Phoenix palm phytoplasma]MBP3059516.1 type I DNA topoisomerase [Texas Phoenix palm phytoplasma]
MQKKVIILESPAKAKTISSYFDDKILVLCSKGHIRNLSLKGKERLGIYVNDNFKPDYEIIPERESLVKELIQKTKGKKVFLATDPDREGEAIAWHLSEILKLKKNEKNRIFFNEITKKVVLNAFENPCLIRNLLVESQETRRIIDRIIGFKLSRLVRKIRAQSAGRVQSVVLKLIIEKEEKRRKFIPEEYFLIKIIFSDFQANLITTPKDKKIKKEEAEFIIDKIKNKSFLLKKINNKKVLNKPPKPYITSLLQQDSFKILNMNSKKTMMIAQKLYEGVIIDGKLTGLITYMRTDSYRISPSFVEEINYFIKKKYGQKYLGTYKEYKNKNSQDAHEAIRPTDINKEPESLKNYLNKNELNVYKIIYQRTLASFMTESVINRTEFIFQNDNYLFSAEGNELLFEGFYKALEYSYPENILPSLKINEFYSAKDIQKIQKITNPPSRYNEASLIKQLEKLKIGRPSTYVNIIEILKKRFYVILVEKKFVPTKMGFLTYQLLEKFFSSIVNVEYTAKIEEKLDFIANGQLNKVDFLKNFYHEFKDLYDTASKEIQPIKPILTDKKCDLCGSFLVKRRGRYSVFLGCSTFPKCKKVLPCKEEEDLI